MPIDPNIVLSARQPQFRDPTEYALHGLQLRDFANRQKLFDRDWQQQDEERKAYVFNEDGSIDQPRTLGNIARVDPRRVPVVQEMFRKNDAAELQRKSAELDQRGKQLEMVGRIIGSLGPNPTPAQIMDGALQASKNGLIADLSTVPSDPTKLVQWYQGIRRQALTAIQQFEQDRAQQKQNWEMTRARTPLGIAMQDEALFLSGEGFGQRGATLWDIPQIAARPPVPGDITTDTGSTIRPFNPAPPDPGADVVAPPAQIGARNPFTALINREAFGNAPAGQRWSDNGTLASIPGYLDIDNAVRIDENGNPIINETLQAAAMAKKLAGANQININTAENKFAGKLGDEIGGQVADVLSRGRAAQQTIATAGRLRSALDSGFVLAGPGASQGRTALQLGRILGVQGKNSEEIILRTGEAMRELARFSVQASYLLKGQGQITESERALLQRAESGDINDFTVPELKAFVNVIDRTARAAVEQSNDYARRLQSDPRFEGMGQYIELPEPGGRSPTAEQRRAAPPGNAGQFLQWDKLE